MTRVAPTASKARADQHAQAEARKKRFLELLRNDELSIGQALAHPDIGVSYSAYKQWRQRDSHFSTTVDLIRSGQSAVVSEWNGSYASFIETYFGHTLAWFQLLFIEELEKIPPGNILMALWPPEHGKTTTYENYASMKIARDPNWRGIIASENLQIAQRIVGRIRNRLEPHGPFPRFVDEWGPFKPQTGAGKDVRISQPWGATYFNVFKKASHDERDYTLLALGRGSSIVSTRTQHLHVDDVQSIKTLGQTDAIEEWFRQDALSRPGETGITTMAGTRVGEDDIYERIAEDESLNGIVKVLRFKAVMTDYTDIENPVERPLWPERYTLENLDRQKRKVGQEAWDRNYMQAPGVSRANQRTFTDECIEKALNPNLSLMHHPKEGSIGYVGLDPALGGQNCIIACEVSPAQRLIVRRIREDTGLQQNEQIMGALGDVVQWYNRSGRITDVVIESMNFQKGLAMDERLRELSIQHGFITREHLTGWNKYDESIGIASMATSFLTGEIQLPWAEDDYTRAEIGELVRQLKAWKPGKKGNKLRQDRVMALWFVWILWRSRWKQVGQASHDPEKWRRKGIPYSATPTGLVLPVGVRL